MVKTVDTILNILWCAECVGNPHWITVHRNVKEMVRHFPYKQKQEFIGT